MRHLNKILIVLSLLVCTLTIDAENLKEVINLEGTWKFLIGDDPARAEVNYDDRNWDYVHVPNSWEKNGFINYDGYAWYRKKFQVGKDIDTDYLFLLLGYIDDVDQVYVNGQLVGGTGIFPPLVRTAYRVLRKYPIPKDLLNMNGENLIAVRVYDDYLNGGITGGQVGFYIDEDNELLSQNLAGYWDFETVNKYNKDLITYRENQNEIFVPALWESLGYSEYDGSATYTKRFSLDMNIHINDELILVLGYIDDIDKVYLNGTKIGTVEDFTSDKDEFYRTFRGYEIPQGLLNSTTENTLVVKVYDVGDLGGIYAGPVGIATNSNYKTLKRNQKEPEHNYWYDMFKHFWE